MSNFYRFKIRQKFGSNLEVPNPSDVISNIKFSSDGSILAVGDNGGRVVIFKRTFVERKMRYLFHKEFIAHQSSSAQAIVFPAHVKQLEWIPGTQTLITANDRNIKLWNLDVSTPARSINDPIHEPLVPIAHYRHVTPQDIVAVCVSPTTPTQIIVVDALHARILDTTRQYPDQAYPAPFLDLAPADLASVRTLITSAALHPLQPTTLAYGTTGGGVFLARPGEEPVRVGGDVSSMGVEVGVTGLAFTADGSKLVARDFFDARVWPTAAGPTTPVVIPLQPGLRIRSRELASHVMGDCFPLTLSPAGTHFLTGEYSNRFIYGAIDGQNVCSQMAIFQNESEDSLVDPSGFAERVTHTAWTQRGRKQWIVCATRSCVHLFSSVVSRLPEEEALTTPESEVEL
eukprot:gnl/Dysnectes_brevis/539_a596_3812.p1 GENE.gnl/Dysnectes_brevis/539_a596_3812~~gnl/Dysnectes_brevis/539_a596_3812.p1  ORF type:complete len:401 (-),score=98.67 gnl/Dysnectes_brevis/539_a596_3812:211-1413(-)